MLRERLEHTGTENSQVVISPDSESVAIVCLVPMGNLEVRMADDVAGQEIIVRPGRNHGLSSCGRDDI